MKVSGFNFVRNGVKLGYPFVESLRSVLPLVDEFMVALGPSNDGTEERIRAIGDPKIRILPTQWNEIMRNDRRPKGFVYGQQKSIAHFNCTGDWAFYLEADEIVHEEDLPRIRAAMEKHLEDRRVEALVFDYTHFYGNGNTCTWDLGWYRSAPRIIRNNIPAWSTDGLYFMVLEGAKRARYPYAAHTGARIYHYGWVRSEEQTNLKRAANSKFWQNHVTPAHYAEIDPQVLRPFQGRHPQAIQNWLPRVEGLFQANPNHVLSSAEKKNRLMRKIEQWFGLELSKKHYRLVR
jgi:hypothetical protein